MIAGDSHVGRLMRFRHIMSRKLYRGDVEVDFVFKGGAHLHHMEEKLADMEPVDLLVLLVGGNDVDDGATNSAVIASFDRIARKALDKGFKAVTITSLWPRRSVKYNDRIFELNGLLSQRFAGYSNVSFWMWDRRQTFKTYDGVHLELAGYKRAIKYLVAAVLWSVKRMLGS